MTAYSRWRQQFRQRRKVFDKNSIDSEEFNKGYSTQSQCIKRLADNPTGNLFTVVVIDLGTE